jgi:hypothetical protein
MFSFPQIPIADVITVFLSSRPGSDELYDGFYMPRDNNVNKKAVI